MDPAARFDEFTASVPRTSTQGEYFSTLANIEGRFYWLISLEAYGHAPASWIHAIADVEYEDVGAGAVVNVNAQGLRQQGVHEVVPGSEIKATDSIVESTGRFSLAVTGTLAAEATPSMREVSIDAQFSGYIQSSDFFCGTVTGQAMAGSTTITLDGSTFGAVRVPPGATSAALPASEKAACPKPASSPQAAR